MLQERHDEAIGECDLPGSELARSRAAKIIKELQDGPLLCADAEFVVHRGQAVVGSLRNAGYIIDTIRRDGDAWYVLRGRVNRIRVTPEMKEAYYKTAHWMATSRLRKEFDGFECVQCFSNSNLETHHWRYELFAEDVERDLITLCRKCHGDYHTVVCGSPVHFPYTVNEEIAKKLGWTPCN